MQRIELGPINVLVGANNSGKSSVLRALYLLQNPQDVPRDIRLGSDQSEIRMDVSNVRGLAPWPDVEHERGSLSVNLGRGGLSIVFNAANGLSYPNLARFIPRDPDHYIVPFFSRRKTALYQEDVRDEFTRSVQPDFGNLAAKLSRLGNSSYPAHAAYDATSQAILGFTVTAIPSTNGQIPGIYLPSRESLPLDQMGEGVPNIAALLADLAQSEDKLFLIEEPENDLHPEALKALLDLIIETSSKNQVVVSTHSNIVMRHLGAVEDTRLFYLSLMPEISPPESLIAPIEPTPEARLRILRELGYQFSDFDLWEGWLILEEASAERIIRDYLVPWFAPKLTRVRTFSAAGNSKVESAFEDFNRLMLFTNLDQAYKNSAWVLVDGDEEGNNIVDRLRTRFSGWNPSRFECFDRADFEWYYPAPLSEEAEQVVAISDKQEKRAAKKRLLSDVIAWLDEDDERGKSELQQSAASVIAHLKRIERDLFGH